MNGFISFFDSNFFIALVTLAVGAFAFGVYIWQKNDQKKDAANIILLEIKNAERSIKRIKDSLLRETLAPDIFLMPSESWTKYKYLFVRDFDRDEWDAITEFYNKCLLIDDNVKYNNSAFWSDTEEIRANKQRILANYAKNCADELDKLSKNDTEKNIEIIENFKKTTELFDQIFMERQVKFGYNPQKPIIDAKLYITGLAENLTLTAIGTKLKTIAKIEKM